MQTKQTQLFKNISSNISSFVLDIIYKIPIAEIEIIDFLKDAALKKQKDFKFG